ncbi:11043_t:CDS:1 [Ambispora gerdemannii]|uniref:11043_t:CDS:1 n=1 Tax=Ambispora gerdemannii TaxID=144530 RepID=A0A9N9DUL6_9GLOM|nr:11043_t:CDS:1 [Ambispora gerdemannii]
MQNIEASLELSMNTLAASTSNYYTIVNQRQDSKQNRDTINRIRQIFELGTSLSKEQMDNNSFVEEFERMTKSLAQEIQGCLNARTQQHIWQRSRGQRLAFWLQ